MSEKYNDHLKSVLTADARLVDEQGDLMLNKIKDFANNLDETLLDILLADDKSRDKFFLKIKEIFVFKQREFISFLERKSLDNSFTDYENRIGLRLENGTRLYRNGKFLKDNTDVVLDFPYKDCVLEGGQSTEEGTDVSFEFDDEAEEYIEAESKRKEIFYNNIIAKDEIDRLFEPKAFENILRYDKEGESVPAEFNRDENGNVKDNLIIKGNNLLALHSLQQEFKGKVKLIYIDPPYNTGSDDFKYNDNFNHSTWLTFMNNRLVSAKHLLRDDGLIFVQCDDREQAYLKILMDSIFGDPINIIIVEMSNLSGNKIEHAIQGRKFPKVKEYILLYAKNRKNYRLTIPKFPKGEWDSEYNMIIPELDEDGYYKIKDFIAENNLEALNTFLATLSLKSLRNHLNEEKIKEEEEEDWKFSNSFRILASKPNSALLRKASSMTFNSILCSVTNSRGNVKIIKSDFNRATPTARIELVFAKDNAEMFIGDIWHNITTTGGVAQEGGVVLQNGKKPEELLYRIIKSATKKGDIVLDYHLGSGTTAAVALKMGRQFVGLEQITNQVNLSLNRLKNVCNGDPSGSSQYPDVNWKGGGSFVYMEMAKHNQTAADLINTSESINDLIALFDELYDKYFLHYNVKIQEFKNKIIKEENFLQLPLDKQKEMFIRMLDNNQLYVNVDDIEDTRYGLNPEDIRLTKDFYQIN